MTLTGHEDSIRETARRTEAFLELDEDKKNSLMKKCMFYRNIFPEKPEIMVTYFVPDEESQWGLCYASWRDTENSAYLRRLLFEDGTEVHMQYIFEMDGEIFGDTE